MLVKTSNGEVIMQFQKMYTQSVSAEITDLISSQPYCYLITTGKEGQHIGMFNHCYDGENFILHLNVNDEQIDDMNENGKAVIVLHRFYSLIPSHWVDAHDASAATAYYKYAEFHCEVDILSDPDVRRSALQDLMHKYQPEGRYAALDSSFPGYKKTFAAIALIRFRPVKMRSKWKFGQNRPAEIRHNIANELRNRARGMDIETAGEVVKLLESRPDGQ
jgi:predicted FMN-binding regulatory protein PaiB